MTSGSRRQKRSSSTRPIPGLPEPHPLYPPQHGPPGYPPPTMGYGAVRNHPPSDTGHIPPARFVVPAPLPTASRAHPRRHSVSNTGPFRAPAPIQAEQPNYTQQVQGWSDRPSRQERAQEHHSGHGQRDSSTTRTTVVHNTRYYAPVPSYTNQGNQDIYPQSAPITHATQSRSPTTSSSNSTPSVERTTNIRWSRRGSYERMRPGTTEISIHNTVGVPERSNSRAPAPTPIYAAPKEPQTRSRSRTTYSQHIIRRPASSDRSNTQALPRIQTYDPPVELLAREREIERERSLTRDRRTLWEPIRRQPSTRTSHHSAEATSDPGTLPSNYSHLSRSQNCPPGGFGYVSETGDSQVKDQREEPTHKQRLNDGYKHVVRRKVAFTPSTTGGSPMFSDSQQDSDDKTTAATVGYSSGRSEHDRGRRSHRGNDNYQPRPVEVRQRDSDNKTTAATVGSSSGHSDSGHSRASRREFDEQRHYIEKTQRTIPAVTGSSGSPIRKRSDTAYRETSGSNFADFDRRRPVSGRTQTYNSSAKKDPDPLDKIKVRQTHTYAEPLGHRNSPVFTAPASRSQPTKDTCKSCQSAAHKRDMASPKTLIKEEYEQRMARGNRPVLDKKGRPLACDKCGRDSDTAWMDRVRGNRLYCWDCFDSKMQWHKDYWRGKSPLRK